jgi:hypothetical protein
MVTIEDQGLGVPTRILARRRRARVPHYAKAVRGQLDVSGSPAGTRVWLRFENSLDRIAQT